MNEDQQFSADWFSKPGDSLRSLMQRREVGADELAGSLDGGITALRGILAGSLAIDGQSASILAERVGGTREFWLRRQANYDLALERAVELAVDREADDWLNWVPSPNAKPRGRMTRARVQEELRRRLAFFNVANIHSWKARYGDLHTNTRFRKSASFSSLDAAVLMWLRRGELEADLVPTREWNPGNLEDRVDAIRRLSRIGQPTRFLPRLRTLCAEAGVATVIVKSPQGCHANGASRLVAANKAMMLLSFRHRTDDQFWFTVFHELGHLILHGSKTFVDEDGTADDSFELEANEFARRCIVPDSRLSEFEKLSSERDSVVRFSVSVGVSPGLTVGQMQFRRMIEYNRLNSLKRRWTWDDIVPALP